MSPDDAVIQAIEVMGAWIDGTDDLTQVIVRLEARLQEPSGARNILCGFVSLCGSMLFDLEELMRVPMSEILQEYERRIP